MRMRVALPFIEKQYRQFREPESQCCRKLRRENDLSPLSALRGGIGRTELTCSKTSKRWSKTGIPSSRIPVCCPKLPIEVPFEGQRVGGQSLEPPILTNQHANRRANCEKLSRY